MVKAEQYIPLSVIQETLDALALSSPSKPTVRERRLIEGGCVVIRLDRRRNGPDRT